MNIYFFPPKKKKKKNLTKKKNFFFFQEVEIKENAKKSIKNYYQQHNEFLSELKSAQERFSSDGEQKINLEEEKDLDDRKKCSVQIAIYASFLVNIVLFVFKVMALVWSKSNSILASAVDSFLDLLAGKKINKTKSKKKKFEYLPHNNKPIIISF